MTADPRRWRRLSTLFDRAVDLEPHARRALLDAECADDPALREELERMLAADLGTGVLDGGVAALVDGERLAARGGHDADAREGIGKRLGAWRLERVLGRGGMGTVYAARRDDGDTGQRAAVKRLHRRWDGSLQAQRFLQERRILAALSHPHLPRLLDHGVDDDGRPWFALELFEGMPLNLAADARRLGLEARIALFRRVCAAVQHAHEHFIVHRDLKPANILVDDDGHPKVLDFGVAKRIDDADGTTRTGAFAGFTPEYAAPEQVTGGLVSAATDVYALGVILYQLLSGCLPYRFDQADLRATAEAISSRTAGRLDQAIAQGTPEEVSSRLMDRGTDAKSFRRFVRGDLARIVQTALAKEPARRYASVQALSSDLDRFLQGRTVSVSGDTFGYRARKFVRRNRWSVAMASLAVASLLGGLGAMVLQVRETRFQAALARKEAERAEAEAGRAQRSLARARSEAKVARGVSDFLGGVFAQATPFNSGGAPLSLPDALKVAHGEVAKDYRDEPETRIPILLAIGNAYDLMYMKPEAKAALRDALAEAGALDPPRPLLLAQAMAMFSQVELENDPDRSLALSEKAVALVDASPDAEDGQRLDALGDLTVALWHKKLFPRALAATQRRIDIHERTTERDQDSYLIALSDKAMILAELRRFDESIATHKRLIALRLQASGREDDLKVTYERANLGRAYLRAERWREAAHELERVLAVEKKVYGDNFRTATVAASLGQAHAGRKDWPAAARETGYALRILDRDPELKLRSLALRIRLAVIHAGRGDCAAARSALARSLEQRQRIGKAADDQAEALRSAQDRVADCGP